MISGKAIKVVIGLASLAGLVASYLGDWAKEKQEEEMLNQKFDEMFDERLAQIREANNEQIQEANFEEIKENE